MTPDDARAMLDDAAAAEGADFPLLDAAIACAIDDWPWRETAPVRALVDNGIAQLRSRLGELAPDEALAETLALDLRLTGEILRLDDPGQTDIIEVCERRRGQPVMLATLYVLIGRGAGLEVSGIDFPGHFLVRVRTPEGITVIDPFIEGREVGASELTRRALRAGLLPHVADRLDRLTASVAPLAMLVRMQNLIFAQAMNHRDHERAERAALRVARLTPSDYRPWLDVAAAREQQGALSGALQALDEAHQRGGRAVPHGPRSDHVRLRLN